MNELQIFNNEKYGEIRTIVDGDKVLFCASDVAKALGYARPADAITTHYRGSVKRRLTDNLGREQETKFIPEGDVYRLIIKNKLPSAEKFESWVFDEVLPTIRKHGMYATVDTIEKMIANPDNMIKIFIALKEEREKRIASEKQLEEAKPKVIFADSVSASDSTISMADMAKLIAQNIYPIGQNRFFAWCRTNGFLITRKGTDYNSPTQKSMNLGLFKIKETTVKNPDGKILIRKTPRVTGFY